MIPYLGFGRPNVDKMKRRGDVEGLIRAFAQNRFPSDRERVIGAIKDIGQLASRRLKSLFYKEFGRVRRDSCLGTPTALRDLALLSADLDNDLGDHEIVDFLVNDYKLSKRKWILNLLQEIGEPAVESLMGIFEDHTKFTDGWGRAIIIYDLDVAERLLKMNARPALEPIVGMFRRHPPSYWGSLHYEQTTRIIGKVIDVAEREAMIDFMIEAIQVFCHAGYPVQPVEALARLGQRAVGPLATALNEKVREAHRGRSAASL